MGQCAGKRVVKKGKEKQTFKSIPPNSPLGRMLDSWDSKEELKELNRIQMIKYCTEIWPKESIAEGPVYWPWYGTEEKWLCVALNRYVNTRIEPCQQEIKYARCWMEREKQEGEIKVYKVSKEREKEVSELPEKRWDPLDHLPPPPPPDPIEYLPLPPPPFTPSVNDLPPPPPDLYPTIPNTEERTITEKSPSSSNKEHHTVNTSSSMSTPFTVTPEPEHSNSSSVLPSATNSTPTPIVIPKTFQNPPFYFSPIFPQTPQNPIFSTPLYIPHVLQQAKDQPEEKQLLTEIACCCKNREENKISEPDKQVGGHPYNTRFQTRKMKENPEKAEKLFPLREVPMGGARGGIGFVNAPLTASEVRNFKKEIKPLLEDPIGISQQLDQFLGPNIYMWEELNSILDILFSSEEIQMIRAAGMKIWERENRGGPRGEDKMPLNVPDWDPNEEEGRTNMRQYRTLIIRGIREAVPRTNNARLAFDSQQEKEESPSVWLERLKRNFRLYSSVDPESPEGQVLVKIQFVTKAWVDIRRKLEKIDDWQEKGMNELLREAQKVYLRRDEEKARTKAKIMVAVARESAGFGNDGPVGGEGNNYNGPRGSELRGARTRENVRFGDMETPKEGKDKYLGPRGPYIGNPGYNKDSRTQWIEGRPPWAEITCFYCGEKGHTRNFCKKRKIDDAMSQEQDALEKKLRGDD